MQASHCVERPVRLLGTYTSCRVNADTDTPEVVDQGTTAPAVIDGHQRVFRHKLDLVGLANRRNQSNARSLLGYLKMTDQKTLRVRRSERTAPLRETSTPQGGSWPQLVRG
jgi:hypothetical protein